MSFKIVSKNFCACDVRVKKKIFIHVVDPASGLRFMSALFEGVVGK